MKISAEKAEELLVLSAKEKVSIDKCDDDETPLIELFSDDEYRPDKIMLDDDIPIDTEKLMKIIETELTPRQADYIKMYFGIGCTRMTYKEIGEEFCVIAKAVEKFLKKKLRASLKTRLIKEKTAMHDICCVNLPRSAVARLRKVSLQLPHLSVFSLIKRVFRDALKIKKGSVLWRQICFRKLNI